MIVATVTCPVNSGRSGMPILNPCLRRHFLNRLQHATYFDAVGILLGLSKVVVHLHLESDRGLLPLFSVLRLIKP